MVKRPGYGRDHDPPRGPPGVKYDQWMAMDPAMLSNATMEAANMVPGHSQITMAVSMRVGSSHDNCRLVMNEQGLSQPISLPPNTHIPVTTSPQQLLPNTML